MFSIHGEVYRGSADFKDLINKIYCHHYYALQAKCSINSYDIVIYVYFNYNLFVSRHVEIISKRSIDLNLTQFYCNKKFHVANAPKNRRA